MQKLVARLRALAHSRAVQRPLRARARRRMLARHKGQVKAERQRDRARKRADVLRAEGRVAAARRQDKVAHKAAIKAERECARAIFWKQRCKVIAQRLHKINTERKQVEADLAEWKRKHEPRVEGNKVKGGTPGERFILANRTAVANCASGRRRNFYSQSGGWDCQHEIAPGPSYDERSDCSQAETGMCWSAGLPDPNGTRYTGGYTGTLGQQNNGWRFATEKEMREKGWGLVLYERWPGDREFHHVEGYIGEGKTDLTAGHGSAPFDYGHIDLFGDGRYVCLIYDPRD